MELSFLFILLVSVHLPIGSYDNEDVIQAYEEAIEDGKDACNVTIDDFELIKLIGKGGYS